MGVSNSKWANAVKPPATNPDLKGIHVLLVDDDADVRGFLKLLLEERGATVQVAGSATEAVAAFGIARPNIIVSDIGMPEENGHSLMRRLRALESGGTPRIPAIALTGHDRAEDRRQAIQAGFQIHVSKPVEAAEFLTIIATFAGRF